MLNGVPSTYVHYAKRTVPCAPLGIGGAMLKFYHLEKPGEPVPPALSGAARGWLREGVGTLLEPGDCGFVILHRCGADFHFLLPAIWRGANEAWEAVAYHHGDMAGFARFDPAYPAPAADAAPPRPTFCVWELAIVAHEALAWSRLLRSDRGESALAQWRGDMLDGEV